jgi:hypothetical protein
MPCGPRCLRCMLEMLSGPVACECLQFLMISAVCAVVNGLSVASSGNLCFRLYMRLSCSVGLWWLTLA